MEIAIRSRNIEVPDSVRSMVEEKVSRLSKYLDGMDHAEIRFLEEKNPRISEREVCEVTLSGHGHVVRAKAASPDPLTSVDIAVGKLEHQLERLKGKLVGRSHPRKSRDGHHPLAVMGDVNNIGGLEKQDGERRIVKAKQFNVKPMTAEEAILNMELIGHDFFLFTNSETGRAALVYRRADGDVGLIDATG